LTPQNIPQIYTQKQIRDYITTSSDYAKGSVNHWSSSCRIGECVDGNTTLIGMRNLHVVDGSIVAPLTVNPQFGIMAAAERASELILRFYGLSIE
jgi:cellobiose dehydrogenase (acceptor)